MSITGFQFDREFHLSDLLSTVDQERIEASLALLLGQKVRITPPDSPALPSYNRLAILWELETLGYVEIEHGTDDELIGAVGLTQLLIKSAARFQMASDIHIETVNADYEILQEKHSALQESETRYKDLAGKLEDKVAQQVQIIQSAQSKLYQAEKMAAVGQLAAGVAHEINTPLAYIQNNLSSAGSYLEDMKPISVLITSGADAVALKEAWKDQDMDYIMEDFPNLMQDSLEGVKKVASIVASLKVFSNIDKSEQMLDDVNCRLQTVIEMLQPQLGEDIRVKFEQGDLPQILCYPGHLGQVFYNIILNGAQAIEDKGTITIKTVATGDEICASVLDSGMGIDKEILDRIFEPFFTTKDVGKGTGLGLTVINDIVTAHGGRIEVKSQVGKGSLFSIFLPIQPATESNG